MCEGSPRGGFIEKRCWGELEKGACMLMASADVEVIAKQRRHHEGRALEDELTFEIGPPFGECLSIGVDEFDPCVVDGVEGVDVRELNLNSAVVVVSIEQKWAEGQQLVSFLNVALGIDGV